MDILSFVIEIVKVVVGPVCTIFYVKRRAKLSDKITVEENKSSAEIVVDKVGSKVDNLHEGINGRMGELMEVSNKVNRVIGRAEGIKESLQSSEDNDIYVYVVDDDSNDLVLIKRAFDKVEQIKYILSTNKEIFKKNIPSIPNVFIIDNKFVGDGETGLDLLKIIVNKNKNNFSIIYTGSSDEKIKKEYKDAGANRFVYKEQNSEKSLQLLIEYVLEGIELVSIRRQ